MKINSDDIKAIQQRVDITYEEAERYLIKAKGDIDLAIYMINRKRESSVSSFLDKTMNLIRELLTYYIKVNNKKRTYINLPLIIIVGLFAAVDVDIKILLLLVSVGLVFISESQVTISKEQKEQDDMILRDDEVEESNEVKETDSPLQKNDDDKKDDDDYYEITIEK